MKKFLVAFLLLATPAFAQQQIDPAALPHVIQQLIQQRDSAMMANAIAQAKIEQLTAELEKLKAPPPSDK